MHSLVRCLLTLSALGAGTGTALGEYPDAVVKLIVTTKDGSTKGGTGFVWERQDQIVTALHVVAGATSCKAVFLAGAGTSKTITVDVTNVRFVRARDLAMLTAVHPPPVTPLQSASAVQAGDRAWSIGFPLDPTNPFKRDLRIENAQKTLGDVLPRASRGTFRESGPDDGFTVGDVIDVHTHVLTLDGTLAPGDSGCPLLNSKNEVVGVGSGGLVLGSNISWAVSFPRYASQLKTARPEPLPGVVVGLRELFNAEVFTEQEGVIGSHEQLLAFVVEERDAALSKRHQDAWFRARKLLLREMQRRGCDDTQTRRALESKKDVECPLYIDARGCFAWRVEIPKK